MNNNINDLKVGDIIRTYHKGFWRILSIEHRYVTKENIHIYSSLQLGEELTASIHYELVCDDYGRTPVKVAKRKCCDAAWCSKVDKDAFDKEVEELRQEFEIQKRKIKEACWK